MGFVVSKLWSLRSPADYDEPDPATGITPRQKDIVQNTWKIVRAETRKNGIQFFIKFFETFPEYQKLFKGFANVPMSELPQNGKLLGHALSVMYALNSIVDNLYDIESLLQVLEKIGVSHQPRNIDGSHFQNLAIVLINFLKEALGPRLMNPAAEEAWRKSLEVANSVIIKALEDTKET
ncbi:hypothetical protein NPIL_313461 [Nephila pilipes]|uniref:Globin domain-containing protein n=1 Tax=Nephila pilipes TaxID=299642 RepID=A0A8X6TYJ1_NEPPI|nr:hypothetical protein NPIL_313461 [Nephila pilipes]